MRLWTIHPRYLDARGLVALWREALLAQAVVLGKTKGYTRHPQLERFTAATVPAGCLAAYLRAIEGEASRRGYRFAASRINAGSWSGSLVATRGQLDYEWRHLQRKVARRSPGWLRQIAHIRRPRPHPIFVVIPGPVANWERPRRSSTR